MENLHEQLESQVATEFPGDAAAVPDPVRPMARPAPATGPEPPPPELAGVTEPPDVRDLPDRTARAPLSLDALSVLAGGVAHHFNNLLCVILGYAEMLMDELQARDEWAAQAREIYTAADKAATLASQLLAFSRKQRATAEAVDLNALIHGLETLLRPLVTEAVRLEIQLSPDLPRVRANRLQLELCVLNLVLNAKEAMPAGGLLTIATDTVVGPDHGPRGAVPLEAGCYARISISDTGRGIAPEIRERMFEPFFTTKDVGQGTGMGLAMVHGIVRQAGGDVRMVSEIGEGSTFSILLPETRSPVMEADLPRPAIPFGGTEAVLVVEDEERVRRLVIKTLARQGYTVIAAGDAEEALAILRDRAEAIELLVTDVVLPGSNGLDLARTVRERVPAVKVLYISGYGVADLARYGELDPDMTLLQKPFRPPELIHAVRQILDRRAVAEESA